MMYCIIIAKKGFCKMDNVSKKMKDDFNMVTHIKSTLIRSNVWRADIMADAIQEMPAVEQVTYQDPQGRIIYVKMKDSEDCSIKNTLDISAYDIFSEAISDSILDDYLTDEEKSYIIQSGGKKQLAAMLFYISPIKSEDNKKMFLIHL